MPAAHGNGLVTLRVALLEADPELGRWLDPGDIAAARRGAVLPAIQLPRGSWEPPRRPDWRYQGFLVLSGLVAREERVAGRQALELVGPGELARPWDQRPDEPLLPRTVAWRVFEPATLAVLGPDLDVLIARFPRLATALLERALKQTTRLATHQAICQLSSVDDRLLVLLWHLAERWGAVTPRGVAVRITLSHRTLGDLVGAKRPTVTLGLRRLADRDRLRCEGDGSWLLVGEPPAEADEPRRALHSNASAL